MIQGCRSLVRRHRAFQKFQCRQLAYESATLKWAAANREVAQRCLDLPTTNGDDSATAPLTSTTLRSWEDYLKWRQWDFPVEVDSNHAKALVSHVLSAPLTIAAHLGELAATQPQRWCIIGARSEASLPVQYWKEILSLTNNTRATIGIDFVGPDVLRRPAVTLTTDDPSSSSSSLTLQWLYNGTFHEYMERTKNPLHAADDMVLVDSEKHPWDAFILLNPGLGHPHLRKDWEPTMRLLLQERATVPILLTAHSERDARRDVDLLTNYVLPEAPLYVPNPFASGIEYEDPFDMGHFVHPNHYVYMLQWQ